MFLEHLLIYYAWPTCLPVEEFAFYHHVVLGDGLQDPSHPARPEPIIAACPETAFYGYVDVGVTTQNLSLEEIARRCQLWKATGVKGVLLDDFGYDFGTTPDRQRAALRAAHDAGLIVIANAWNPADALSVLEDDDIFLLESFQLQTEERSAVVKRYRQHNIFSIATGEFDQEVYDRTWTWAMLNDHRANGWGEPNYSAHDGLAPRRQVWLGPARRLEA